ncbi:MAG: glycosyltransferase [Lachnospiraceae bacterium]|nr:glycosyltransferase [Lachnospiraceae bacterium]
MALQLLISALNKDPAELIAKMNIQTDAVLVNQCDEDVCREIPYRENTVLVLSKKERGVGRSRNLCMEKATAEYVLFSDDDIVYDDGYEEKVLSAFEKNDAADVILFNMKVSPERKTYWNESEKSVSKFNCGRYPAYSIAAKRESLQKADVRFSLLFGGGAKYSNGEDSLFLTDCLRGGLKLFTSTEVLGKEEPGESTWFHGFTEKFFYDRGVLFAFLYKGFALLWAFRYVFLKRDIDSSKIGKKKAWKLICDGIKEGNKLRK